jgi:hypothetical protein
MPTLPMIPLGRPALRVISVQCSPPSVVAAADQQPGLAARLPERGVEHVWIRRVHHELDRARRVISKEDFLPGLAAVGGLEHAAFGIRRPDVAERGHVRHVRVARIEHDARDLLRLLEPDVLPRLAGVGGLPHSVAVRHVAANRILAAADPDYIGILLVDGNGADAAAEVGVAHRYGGLAAVGGFPDTTARGAEVVLSWTRDRTGNGDDSTGGIGADDAPAHVAGARAVRAPAAAAAPPTLREQETWNAHRSQCNARER